MMVLSYNFIILRTFENGSVYIQACDLQYTIKTAKK